MESSVQRMREGFEEILEKIDAWRTDGTMEHWQYSQLFDIANSALALPLRNCDVGTPDEQNRRFDNFCREEEDCKICPCNVMPRCHMAWAQMLYAEEGGAK